MSNRNLILHPFFIGSLIILLLNDFYFKQAFPNYLTGKLSDFSGLIVFPIFVAYLLPNSNGWVALTTGILFVIWKTPLVSPLIEFVSLYSPFVIQRIVDYSDYWALIVLPVAHRVIKQDVIKISEKNVVLKVASVGVVAVSFFAICATSVAPRRELPKGTVYIGEEYTVRKSKDETIEMIKSLGYNVDYHDDSLTRLRYYQTDNIAVFNDDAILIGTILNVKYALSEPKEKRTNIEIINVTLSEEGNIQKWQTLKYLRKKYKKLLEKQMIDPVK